MRRVRSQNFGVIRVYLWRKEWGGLWDFYPPVGQGRVASGGLRFCLSRLKKSHFACMFAQEFSHQFKAPRNVEKVTNCTFTLRTDRKNNYITQFTPQNISAIWHSVSCWNNHYKLTMPTVACTGAVSLQWSRSTHRLAHAVVQTAKKTNGSCPRSVHPV